jgi:hypothetical protein
MTLPQRARFGAASELATAESLDVSRESPRLGVSVPPALFVNFKTLSVGRSGLSRSERRPKCPRKQVSQGSQASTHKSFEPRPNRFSDRGHLRPSQGTFRSQ